jgi:hypothetical protein
MPLAALDRLIALKPPSYEVYMGGLDTTVTADILYELGIQARGVCVRARARG